MTHFIKAHGAGNDFVIFDSPPPNLLSQTTKEVWQNLADRHRGIGCDQIIILAPSQTADIKMVIINSDGSPAETCGNAARCVARIIKEKNNQTTITIESQGRILTATILPDDKIMVNMGIAEYDWQKIPLKEKCDSKNLPLTDEVKNLKLLKPPLAVNVGNPHLVLWVEDCEKIPLHDIGKILEQHPLFPQRVNVSFLSFLDNDSRNGMKGSQARGVRGIRLRVWERGAGATLACGSAAVAVRFALAEWQALPDQQPILIQMDGGVLTLALNDQGEALMTGEAVLVFAGDYRI